MNYRHFELNNITIEKNKSPRLVLIECNLAHRVSHILPPQSLLSLSFLTNDPFGS